MSARFRRVAEAERDWALLRTESVPSGSGMIFRQAFGLGVLVAFVALASGGCDLSDPPSGSESESQGQARAIEDSFATDFAKGLCAGYQQCACDDLVGAGDAPFADQAACEAQMTTRIQDWQADEVASGKHFNAECAVQRLVRFAGDVCHDEARPDTTCGECDVYAGTFGLGAACLPGGCESGLKCVAGVCVEPCRPLLMGEGCLPSVNQCQTGLRCSNDGKCVDAAKEGESCGEGTPCGQGLICLDGACVLAALPGEVCGERPCAFSPCVDGVCSEFSAIPRVCGLN